MHLPMTEPTAHSRKRVSLVIPMFSECEAIGVLPTLVAYDFEIFCVNDGSTDLPFASLMRESAA